MWNEFIVTDAGGNVSCGADENPERFKTFKAAEKRAKELAELDPGKNICIYELTATTISHTEPPVTSRKHPVEHYRGR